MRFLFGLWLVLVICPCLLAAQDSDVYRPQFAIPPQPDELTNGSGQVVQATFLTKDDGKDLDSVAADKKETQEKRDDVAEKIRVAERKVQEEQQKKVETDPREVATTPGVSSDEETRLRLLKQVDVILAQLEQQAVAFEDTKKELADRTDELLDVNNGQVGIEKPYSFLLLDQLEDELAALQAKVATGLLNQTLTNEDIIQAKKLLEQKEQAYRQAKENKEIVLAVGAADNSRYLLEVRLANETLSYRKKRLEILKLGSEIIGIQVEISKKKIEAIQDETAFSEEDLSSKKNELSKREEDLRRRLARNERDMEDSDTKWLIDRMLLNSGTKPTPLESEEIEYRRLERQVLQTIASSLNFRLELLNQSRQAWDHRYQLHNSISTGEENIEFENVATKNIQQRDRDLSNRMLQLEELRKTAATLDSKAAGFPDDEPGRELKRIIDRQKNSIRSRTTVLDEDIASIQANRRVLDKLLKDIQGDANRFSFNEIWQTTWYYTKSIWNTELTAVDERPITIGKILTALAIFLGGFWLARFVSRRLRGFLTLRLKIDESAAAAFQSLAFYSLVLAFVLGALNFVSIPLTVFTFLGGALAIGVGFGSQNILSNFISGLILLAERPVKVGDLIQMDEFYGNVENIGARSTIVRTGTNLKLIVPNSRFLENNVINLTHGNNDLFRTHVSVGVAYGSSTRQVTKLLKQAADDHGLVMKYPERFVLFKEFGDNSLKFELHFWISVSRPLDRLKMESDIRFRIDSLFNEAGVVISFPQRDVHVDSLGPIDIRLVNGGELSRLAKNEAA